MGAQGPLVGHLSLLRFLPPQSLTPPSEPCPQDGCPNATCSGELVFQPCAPCPLTCDDISGQATCSPDRPCHSPGEGALGSGSAEATLSAWKPHPAPSLGCWCPEGQVLGSEGQCVWPRQCPCLVDGARYWPGQRIKVNCQLCVCQDGRPRRCQPNPDCASEYPTSCGPSLKVPVPSPGHPAGHLPLPPDPNSCPPSVNCGWSSWSPWAECLGPCGSQSVQWSFRSPNNPRLSGRGRQCRGIRRKARRYQPGPSLTFAVRPACPFPGELLRFHNRPQITNCSAPSPSKPWRPQPSPPLVPCHLDPKQGNQCPHVQLSKCRRKNGSPVPLEVCGVTLLGVSHFCLHTLLGPALLVGGACKNCFPDFRPVAISEIQVKGDDQTLTQDFPSLIT